MNRLGVSLVFLSAVLGVSGAQAQVYKCVGPTGKKTFQSTPCSNPKAKESQVRIYDQSTLPAVRVRHSEPKTVEGKRSGDHPEYVKIMAEKEHNRNVQNAITKGELVMGMTQEEVRRAWGSPCRINPSNYRSQWVYCRDNSTLRDNVYLYFDQDGKYDGRNGAAATKRHKDNWRN